MLDLYYFSFHIIDQVHQPDLPGILVSAPPKKNARGREGDLLILFLSLNGHNPYSTGELEAMLQRAAHIYYHSSGSLTAGMRAAADACNNQLMERNLKNARDEGGQAIARLNLAVLRDDVLFLAVAGPTHALLLGAGDSQHFFDPQAGRGLGTGPAISLRYFQTQVKAGDVLAFSPDLPAAWSPAALAGAAGLTLEHLRRRLLNGAGPALQAVVFKFQPGSGNVHALRHRSTALSTTEGMAHAPLTDPESAHAPSGYLSEAAAPPVPSIPSIPSMPLPARSAPPISAPSQRSRPTAPAGTALPPEPSPVDSRASQAAALEAARLARHKRLERKQKAAGLWNGWKIFSARLSRAWQGLWGKLAPAHTRAAPPGGVAPVTRVSPAVLVFIAIAVPLMVVAMAMTVYLQTGRGQQRSEAFEQASLYASQALAEKDLSKQRSAWNQVLVWLDKTEEYGVTAESRELRTRAQQGVDQGDAVVRLAFQPINRVGLAQTVKISRMVANNEDLYLLDDSNGSVLRMFMTAQGYELDTHFDCGPGPVQKGSLIVGPIIDIAPMPPVNLKNATVAALDGNGNLLVCIPGQPAEARSLLPPNVGWGKITSLALGQNTLFVMDVLGNAIWQYEIKNNPNVPNGFFELTERPSLYSGDFNLSLADVLDLAFYENNVFFVRGSGQLTQCKVSRIDGIPTRCFDPAVFSDPRAGREPKTARMPDTTFSQILSINAPDPSLFFLDTSHASIYRFSMALNFQDQMRPSTLSSSSPLPRREPTAFTITPRRVVFMAYGNQVFMAQMQ